MALWSSIAATLESTPPDRPSMTLSSPSFSRSSATVDSMKFSGVQSPLHPQMPITKFLSICEPYSLWCTSGWNCMPQVGSPFRRKAALSTVSVEPITSASAGRRVIVSPCDIHTVELAGMPANRGSEESSTLSWARPYSRVPAGATSPPPFCAGR